MALYRVLGFRAGSGFMFFRGSGFQVLGLLGLMGVGI